MISPSEYLAFVDQELSGMEEILSELGDELANSHLDAPQSNSPYAILNHCLGVIEYWGGHIAHGRANRRDRPAEFTAQGSVEALLNRASRSRQQLEADITGVDFAEPPAVIPDMEPTPWSRSIGGVLVHIYEELARHRGQMEVTRDVLLLRQPPRP